MVNSFADGEAVIAANRFGLGARDNELAEARQDPRHWLLQQLRPPQFDPGLGDTVSALETISSLKAAKRRNRQRETNLEDVNSLYVQPFRNRLYRDSLSLAITTASSFAMRLLDFFSNHFSVSAANQPLAILAPTLEREAIAPNLFGQFADLLIAVVQHPAMLVYLNNEKSVGPNSVLGQRSRGLNENLAREILELHTLGRDGGYSLQDIRELALAISGWSLWNNKELGNPGFVYRPRGHEPGSRKILGTTYADTGLQQGQAILRDLARHPKTAEFVSYKLAQHLIAEQPPSDLVAAMTKTWLKTEGNIKAVVTTLVKHPQSWQIQRQKYKTPREFVVSACRAVSTPEAGEQLVELALRGLNLMGQKPFSANSPAGFSQLNRDWMGSDALMKRIDWVNLLCKKRPLDPQPIARRIFDYQVSDVTISSIAAAESSAQGLALLLLCPEFQRR